MTCPSCGLQIGENETICFHHLAHGEDDWAAANREACDFFHRGIQPPDRPTPSDLLESMLLWPPLPPAWAPTVAQEPY